MDILLIFSAVLSVKKVFYSLLGGAGVAAIVFLVIKWARKVLKKTEKLFPWRLILYTFLPFTIFFIVTAATLFFGGDTIYAYIALNIITFGIGIVHAFFFHRLLAEPLEITWASAESQWKWGELLYLLLLMLIASIGMMLVEIVADLFPITLMPKDGMFRYLPAVLSMGVPFFLLKAWKAMEELPASQPKILGTEYLASNISWGEGEDREIICFIIRDNDLIYPDQDKHQVYQLPPRKRPDNIQHEKLKHVFIDLKEDFMHDIDNNNSLVKGFLPANLLLSNAKLTWDNNDDKKKIFEKLEGNNISFIDKGNEITVDCYWVFFKEPWWFPFRKSINPDLTFKENGLLAKRGSFIKSNGSKVTNELIYKVYVERHWLPLQEKYVEETAPMKKEEFVEKQTPKPIENVKPDKTDNTNEGDTQKEDTDDYGI